ncbi:NAD(P)-binding protein [Candidatus Roizmanbacteria bacterium]|nr:MAG: NAD(P)-binding protein [Candidatus Roizmanbacteria bacterium]
MPKKVIIIGSGFGGLSSAALLAKAGYDVTVLEKNKSPGGRAMQFSEKGFTFDMGPSWYMMPEVFDRYFAHFGKTPSSFYKLVHLDPHYRIFFSKDDVLDMLPDKDKNFEAFEKIEPGSVEK